MSRAQTTDPLSSCRFHATATDLGDAIKFTGGIEGAEAGFTSITLPEVTVDVVEYKEGKMKYTKKYPGNPTFSDVTLIRGLMLNDTVFYDWVMNSATSGEYRTQVIVWQYHRMHDESSSSSPITKYTGGRKYVCEECLPTRGKPGPDLDATAAEIGLTELDFALEYFYIDLK